VYAQLVRSGTTHETRTEMDRIVTKEVIPALHEEPGFTGALNLVDRQNGNAMMIVFWKTADEAQRPPRKRGANVIEALSHIVAASSGKHEPISVWEVNVRV
jgi:hypothetical protein